MKQDRPAYRALALARVIYDECFKSGEADGDGGVPLPFDEARKLRLDAYCRARKAAERIIADSRHA